MKTGAVGIVGCRGKKGREKSNLSKSTFPTLPYRSLKLSLRKKRANPILAEHHPNLSVLSKLSSFSYSPSSSEGLLSNVMSKYHF